MTIYEEAMRHLAPDWRGDIIMAGAESVSGFITLTGAPPNKDTFLRYISKNKAFLEASVELKKLDEQLPRHIEDVMDAANCTYYREMKSVKKRKTALRKVIQDAKSATE